jgi:TatD DNase family protein
LHHRQQLIIHTRDASADTLAIMREEGAADVGGVMHCFTESLSVAKQAMEMDFHISFSGIVTFRNASELREVARQVPLDRLLVETDAPYLAPVPMRGKRNEPAFVRYIAKQVADTKTMSFEEVAYATSANFFRLFQFGARNDV